MTPLCAMSFKYDIIFFGAACIYVPYTSMLTQ